jgi:hypothetical protein
MRLAEVAGQTRKPWVAVVDSGKLYDPLVELLEGHGIPTLRSADRALMLLNVFCREKIRTVAELESVSLAAQ